MFDRLFPKQLDNRFAGFRLAIWLLVPIVLLRAVIGFNSVMFTRSIAMSADAIPLDRFGADAAQTVVSLFALLGLYTLLFALLGAIVLIRYRAMVPFMYLVLLVQQLGSRALLLANPVVRSGSTSVGSAVVFATLAMTVVGFILSLARRSNSRSS
jgi:hypothetical protein